MKFNPMHKTVDGLFLVDLLEPASEIKSKVFAIKDIFLVTKKWQATNVFVRVYNTKSQVLNDKNLYIDKDNRLYFVSRFIGKVKKYYLDNLVKM